MPDTQDMAVANEWGLGYRGPASGFDEMVFDESRPRSHWQSFLEQVGTIGLPELRQRWEDAQHLIRENGVTYNVYGDPQGLDRPWELDPIPLLISPADAQVIDVGLSQRARLLDRVLADLYGPQQLLSRGILPPELVFGHPGFLRACHGVKVPGDRYLHLYAADLGRSSDGAFHILADRTQAPSGAGYALENRIVLSRMLPEAFKECRVQRLALFFRALRDGLRSISPGDRDNPRIVLLTPGPYNETYFEHAYLARYLGYTLVEGADLTVRDNRVYLKLLGGLQPVDVILRRLDDDFCDPLELRRDSFLGVPGLVQVIRSGNVALANPLGSGLVESPAMLAYLPEICRQLLGEDLRIPSVPTWWCGDPASLDHVLANLSRMVIKPTFGAGRSSSVFGAGLDADQRAALADAIRAKPVEYVGQEQLPLSTSPVLADDGFRSRHLVLRAFLTATDSGYAVMPGGLTRITRSSDSLVVTMQKGGGSKDTWVLTDGPVSTFSLLPRTVQPVGLSRGGGDLPSRVADDLFWLGRYVERVESTVRLLRGILIRLTERSGVAEVPELSALLRALTYQTYTYPGFIGQGAVDRLAAPEAEILSVVGDSRRPGTLASMIQSLHRTAGKVRDRFSIDMWRILGDLDLDDDPSTSRGSWDGRDGDDVAGIGRACPLPRRLGEIRDMLDRKVLSLAAFAGLVAESMTRGQGWRFLDMGRRLERSLRMAGLLRSTVVRPEGPKAPLLEAILEIADSSMTYRRRYMSHIQTAPVLDLLLADESNPRSLAFQLAELAEGFTQLPRDDAAAAPGEEQRINREALARIRDADLAQLARVDEAGDRPVLDALLSAIESDIPAVSDALGRAYFSHLLPSRQFSRATGAEIDDL